MTEPTNRPDDYDYDLEHTAEFDDEPRQIEMPGRRREDDALLDATPSEADTSALILVEDVEEAVNDPDYDPNAEEGSGEDRVAEPAEDLTEPAEPSLDDTAAAALPDFDRPAARRLVNSDADPLTEEDARDFVEHAYAEHMRTQLAFALVLLGPAALFFTLWWPFGMPNGVSFVERSPVLAITIGLAAALALIAAGLVVHFKEGKRPHILRRIEQGTLVPSEESRDFAEQHWQEHAGHGRLLTFAGWVLAILSLVALVWGAMKAAGGSFPGLFLGLAFSCLMGTIAFLCLYSVFALKRAHRALSA